MKRNRARKPKFKLNRQTFLDRLGDFWEGKYLVRSMNTHALRWVVALALFCLVSIFNSYHSLRQKSKVDRLDREITELRMEYVSTSSTLMGARRLSAIENRVSEEGLDISIPKNPPIIIDR